MVKASTSIGLRLSQGDCLSLRHTCVQFRKTIQLPRLSLLSSHSLYTCPKRLRNRLVFFDYPFDALSNHLLQTLALLRHPLMLRYWLSDDLLQRVANGTLHRQCFWRLLVSWYALREPRILLKRMALDCFPIEYLTLQFPHLCLNLAFFDQFLSNVDVRFSRAQDAVFADARLKALVARTIIRSSFFQRKILIYALRHHLQLFHLLPDRMHLTFRILNLISFSCCENFCSIDRYVWVLFYRLSQSTVEAKYCLCVTIRYLIVQKLP